MFPCEYNLKITTYVKTSSKKQPTDMIFPIYLKKIHYEIPRNIPKQCSGNILEYQNIPWLFHEHFRNVKCIFLGGSRNTIVVFSSG